MTQPPSRDDLLDGPRDGPRDDPRADDARDAWLREALRHAPDAPHAPPPMLREEILRQARAAAGRPAAKPAPLTPGQWLVRAWRWLSVPGVATGFASLMVATVVGLMWWDRPIDNVANPELRDAGAPVAQRAPAVSASGAADASDASRAANAADAAAPASAPRSPAPPMAAMAPSDTPPPQAAAPAESLRAAQAGAARDERRSRDERQRLQREQRDESVQREADAHGRARKAEAARAEPGGAATGADARLPAASTQREPGQAPLASREDESAVASSQARPAAPSPSAAPADHAADRAFAQQAERPTARGALAARAPVAAAKTLAAPPDANELAAFAASIQREPARWQWLDDSGAPQPMTPALQTWSAGQLDAAARALEAGNASSLAGSAGPPAVTLSLLRDAAPALALRLDARGLLRVDVPGRAPVVVDAGPSAADALNRARLAAPR